MPPLVQRFSLFYFRLIKWIYRLIRVKKNGERKPLGPMCNKPHFWLPIRDNAIFIGMFILLTLCRFTTRIFTNWLIQWGSFREYCDISCRVFDRTINTDNICGHFLEFLVSIHNSICHMQPFPSLSNGAGDMLGISTILVIYQWTIKFVTKKEGWLD